MRLVIFLCFSQLFFYPSPCTGLLLLKLKVIYNSSFHSLSKQFLGQVLCRALGDNIKNSNSSHLLSIYFVLGTIPCALYVLTHLIDQWRNQWIPLIVHAFLCCWETEFGIPAEPSSSPHQYSIRHAQNLWFNAAFFHLRFRMLGNYIKILCLHIFF